MTHYLDILTIPYRQRGAALIYFVRITFTFRCHSTDRESGL